MMKSIRLAILMMAMFAAVSACLGSGGVETTAVAGPPVTTSSGVQRQPEGASSFFSIEEIGIDPDGWVALKNFTDVTVTLDGLFLCQDGECLALPDENVGAGETAYIVTGQAPDVDGVVVAGASIGTLAPADGEVALFVTQPGSTDSLIAFLEWGSTPHSYTEMAISRGLWLEDSYAPAGENAVRLYRNPESGLWLWDTR